MPETLVTSVSEDPAAVANGSRLSFQRSLVDLRPGAWWWGVCACMSVCVWAQVELLQRQMEWEVQRRQRLAAAAEALARERLRQAEDDAAKTASSYWPSDAMPTREQNAAALKVGSCAWVKGWGREVHLPGLGLRLGASVRMD